MNLKNAQLLTKVGTDTRKVYHIEKFQLIEGEDFIFACIKNERDW